MSISATRWVYVDDTDSGLEYFGSWFSDPSKELDSVGNFGPTYEATLHGTRSTSSFVYRFSGTGVRVHGTNRRVLDSESGVWDPSWECFVDDIRIEPGLASTDQLNNFLFCQQDELPDGLHTLTMNVTVSEEQVFLFDQLQYIPSPGLSLEDKTVSITVDDTQVQAGLGTSWYPILGNSSMGTQTTNDTFTLQFVGRRLSWYGVIPSGFPTVGTVGTYVIDGGASSTFSVPAPSNESAVTEYNIEFFQTPMLSQGVHNISVASQGSAEKAPLNLAFLLIHNGSSSVTSLPPSKLPSTTSGPPTSSTMIGPSNTGLPSSSHRSLHIKSIIAGAVAGGSVVLIIVGAVWYMRHRRRRSAQDDEAKQPLRPFPFTDVHTRAYSVVRGQAIKGVTENSSGHSRKGGYHSTAGRSSSREQRFDTQFIGSTVHHVDSGIRLLDTELEPGEEDIIEVPPVYAPV